MSAIMCDHPNLKVLRWTSVEDSPGVLFYNVDAFWCVTCRMEVTPTQVNASASPPGDDEYGLAKAYEQVADHLPPGWKL